MIRMRGFAFTMDALFALILCSIFLSVIYNLFELTSRPVQTYDPFGEDVARIICQTHEKGQYPLDTVSSVFQNEGVCGYVLVGNEHIEFCPCQRNVLTYDAFCSGRKITVGWCRP